MTQHINLPLMGLLALSAALAPPAAFAQSATPTADAAQVSSGQPASPAPQSDEPAKKTWDDLDSNKDGNLDKTEVSTIPSLQAVFDQADANADGALSGEEYKRYLAVNGEGNTTPAKPKK